MCDFARRLPGLSRTRARTLAGALKGALACAFVALPMLALPAAAQQRADAYDAQAARARASYGAAAAHVVALSRTLDSLEEDRRRKQTTDSVHAGGVLVRIVGAPLPATSRAAMDRAADSTWALLMRLNDTSVTSLVSRVPLELEVDERTAPIHTLWLTLGFPATVSGDVRLHGRSIDAMEARAALVQLYGGAVGTRLPRGLVHWMSSEWAPLERPTADDWQRVATELATSRSSIARSCLATVAACRAVLELDATPTDPTRSWYRPEDYPAIVAEWNPSDSANNALRARCVRDGVAAACETAMTILRVPRPLDAFPKISLVMLALDRGGAGAFQRLTTATGTPAEMLSTAARIPIDELVAVWRTDVIGAPVPHSRPGAAELAAVGVWTLVFGALAVRRRP